MSILLGTTVNMVQGSRQQINWMPNRTINGHGLIVGASGVGKTHRIRIIAQHLAYSYNARVIVVDVHGDIELRGEDRVSFTESSPYGLNPLKINPDRHSGGVNRRIRAFLSMLSRTSMRLGPRQEAALRRLIEDLYKRNGFDSTDWRTWDPRTNPNVAGRSAHHGVCPNISDLKKFTAYKLKQLKTGAGGEAFRALTDLNRHVKSMHKAALKAHGTEESLDTAAKEKLEKLKGKAKETYAEVISHLETGEEINDLLRYTDAATLEGVLDRIDHLDKSGIFKDSPPPVNHNKPIHVYDIKSLGRDEQKMFVEILLEEIWQEQKSRGQRSQPDTFIVIDEASIFMSEDPDHIINILMRESRKFGLGLIFASQSVNHFSEDILANVGLKLLLGVDQMFIPSLSRMLRVDGAKIDAIRPRKSALVQTKIVGDQKNDFSEIYLAES